MADLKTKPPGPLMPEEVRTMKSLADSAAKSIAGAFTAGDAYAQLAGDAALRRADEEMRRMQSFTRREPSIGELQLQELAAIRVTLDRVAEMLELLVERSQQREGR